MVKVVFDMRSSMTRNIKDNFSSIFDNKGCNLNGNDTEAVDSQSHVLQCSILLDNLSYLKQVEYSHIFGTLEQQRKVVLVLARMLERREELLEVQGIPVGTITGPDPTVTNV